MKLQEILKDLEIIEMSADPEMEIAGVQSDSRLVEPGELFVAVCGFESDGHRFIDKAVSQGACAVLCQERPKSGVPFILVKNTRLGLALTSRNFYGDPASSMTMIGFTGTNGKTTSTYLMKHLLEHSLGAKVGLVGTNGNMIGDRFIHAERTTPESSDLQRLLAEMRDEGCTHVVMEVSSHSLVLDRVAGIDFNVGVFTNLTQDHLDFHGTMAQYAKAKSILFSHCQKAVINADDEYSRFMLDSCACPKLSYSAETKLADLTANDIRLSANGVKFLAVYEGSIERVNLAIPGLFSVHNALGVIGAGLSLGISLGGCCEAMTDAKGVKGRVEVVPTGEDFSVVIDYAHTPDALVNVLTAMRGVTTGRLLVLFGCGGDRDAAKRPMMGKAAAELADLCIVTSDNPRTEEPEAIINDIVAGMKDSLTPTKVICDRREAIGWAIENHQPGDVIVLAGKGHEDYQVVGHEKHHMDEREIVAEYLEKRKN